MRALEESGRWPMLDVVVRLHASAAPVADGAGSRGGGAGAGSLVRAGSVRCELADCLDEFGLAETLDEADRWRCPRCSTASRATKKLDIWRCPDMLIVHLKRFVATAYSRGKAEGLVDFPLAGLDVAPWIANPHERTRAVYDLFAVSHHAGTLGAGHYTATVRNLVSGKWFSSSDAAVREVDAVAEIKSDTAYVLFYARRPS